MTPVIIVTIVFASVLILVKMTLDYNQTKQIERPGTGDERSLGTSELRRLIQEAVAEEVHPLAEKVDRMENRLLPSSGETSEEGGAARQDSSGESGGEDHTATTQDFRS